MKKEWSTPELRGLAVKKTMAAGYEGYHDEAYVEQPPGSPQWGPHHES